MLNTYVNDYKLDEYPFYQLGKAPFPPGCIQYIGVCIKGTPERNPVFASSITFSMDGVLVSLCRETNVQDVDVVIGSIYAPADIGSASMPLSGGVVEGSVSLLFDKNMLADCYGTYTGKFYLDPSCVMYLDSTYYGEIQRVSINGEPMDVAQGLDFSCIGNVIQLVETNITAGTVTALLRGSDTVDTYKLVNTVNNVPVLVNAVNNLIPDISPETLPTLNIVSMDPDAVVITGSTTKTGDVVVELLGTTAFPNCYDSALDEAVAQPVEEAEQEDTNADDSE